MKSKQLIIRGNVYILASELITALGISRQTLWRWRQDGHVPTGSKYRDRVLVFTQREADQIRDFAHRVVPTRATESIERGSST